MITEEYKSNSIASRSNQETPAKVERKIVGEVKVKQKNGIGKVREELGLSDAGTVFSFIFSDVLVPAFKKLLSDVVNRGINLLLYGDDRDSGRYRDSGSKTPYRSYYESASWDNRRRDDRDLVVTTRTFNVDDVVLREFVDADNIRLDIIDLAHDQRVVSVLDVYNLITRKIGSSSIPAPDYTYEYYGWSERDILERIRIQSCRDGWYVSLPKPSSIRQWR